MKKPAVFCAPLPAGLTACGTPSTAEAPPAPKRRAPGVTEDPEGLIDFILEAEAGREAVVLQLTDPQIIDSSQKRYPERLSREETAFWSPDKMEDRCFSYIRETVRKTRPDLILITGDLVYGSFDDKGSALTALIGFMESLGLPWAPVMGNHDNESAMGADWQCRQLEQAEHCLFRQRTLTGNGNYTVGLRQGGEVKRVFFMMDSNGCGGAINENGHTATEAGFGDDQTEWFLRTAGQIREKHPGVKFTFAFHIQMDAFVTAYSRFGYSDEPFLAVDLDGAGDGTDFGYIGEPVSDPWDRDHTVYRKMKDLGTDSVLIGHEHCNNASAVYDGIRFQYGQKSSHYDQVNYLLKDGRITGTFAPLDGRPLIGGTVLKLSPADGSITDAYIQYWDE